MLTPEQIVTTLKRHPRIEYQNLVMSSEELSRLRNSLPELAPFGGARYAGVLPVIDWDHRLPSRLIILRVYAYYSETSLRAGLAELESRIHQIKAQDRFPEFDVSDFSGISADEAYEAELAQDATMQRIRLVSIWRREISLEVSRNAVNIVRSSEQFQRLSEETRDHRPDYLGDLEAVSWTPPCESNLGNWTIDVWYLMHLDTEVGKGRSFLVDLEQNQVVGVREFVVRSG